MSRSALDRENRHLRSEISRLNADHRQQVNAKNKEIERLHAMTPAGLKTLFAQYRHLEDLLTVLIKVADLADPIQGIAYDTDKVTTADDTYPIEGQGTRADRQRMSWAGQEISKLTHRIEVSVKPKGEHSEGLTGGPQCWRRQCEGRGLKQSWDNDACGYCGDPFSTYASVVREVAQGQI
jgi:hypothetical protein